MLRMNFTCVNHSALPTPIHFLPVHLKPFSPPHSQHPQGPYVQTHHRSERGHLRRRKRGEPRAGQPGQPWRTGMASLSTGLQIRYV